MVSTNSGIGEVKTSKVCNSPLVTNLKGVLANIDLADCHQEFDVHLSIISSLMAHQILFAWEPRCLCPFKAMQIQIIREMEWIVNGQKYCEIKPDFIVGSVIIEVKYKARLQMRDFNQCFMLHSIAGITDVILARYYENQVELVDIDEHMGVQGRMPLLSLHCWKRGYKTRLGEQ